jgi:hypothetical protein
VTPALLYFNRCDMPPFLSLSHQQNSLPCGAPPPSSCPPSGHSVLPPLIFTMQPRAGLPRLSRFSPRCVPYSPRVSFCFNLSNALQGFLFDWNPPGTTIPIPITRTVEFSCEESSALLIGSTEQCETLHITWDRGSTGAGWVLIQLSCEGFYLWHP